MLFENMSMAVAAIKANKMRSFLTMLGIIIGIGSVIAIVSIGDSMRAMVAGMYQDVGETRGIVYTDWQVSDLRQTDNFSLDELERIKEVFGEEISYIIPNMSETIEAVNGRKKEKISLSAVDSNYNQVQSLDMLYGRMIDQQDVAERRDSILLEADGAKSLFGTENAVGRTFRATLYGRTADYTVVGVYKKKLSPLQAMLMGPSQTKDAYAAYTLFIMPNDLFGMLDLYAAKGTDAQEFSGKITAFVGKLHGRPADEIRYESVAAEMGSIDSILNGMSAAVGGIAAISLLVGGIGIMNIMLVSVTERTREIGIRKALGATTGDVLVQFLTESAILSVIGGIIGVLIGVGIVSLGGAALSMKVVIRPGVILLAVSFSALVGIFFGLYPASKAAKKDPIDALRYE